MTASSPISKKPTARNNRLSEQQPRADLPQIVTMLTTEHFALQSARSAALADAQSRSTIFLTSISSALVALAFLGQATKMGETFFAFVLVIFATLYGMGVVTFLRVVQTAVEDTIHARGINRIRHYYVEIAPQIEPYFIHSINDDMRGMIADMGLAPGPWQTFLTSSAMLSFIASVILGVFVAVFCTRVSNLAMSASLIAAAFCAGGSFWFLQRVATQMWSQSEGRFPARFPSDA